MAKSGHATCGIARWDVLIAESRWHRFRAAPMAFISGGDRIKAGARRAIATDENMVGSARGTYGASDHTDGVNAAGRQLRL